MLQQGPSATIGSPAGENLKPARVSVLRMAVWIALYYAAWFINPLTALFSQGAMPDPDDFLRLHQVQNWLQGQAWYDVSVSRMNAPLGADLHWSRLIDVPIAAIAVLMEPVAGQAVAFRIAALIWPALVLFATLMTLVAIVERIWPSANRLVTVFFAVSNIAALTMFAPGRIDHHNVQALLVFLAVLGLIAADKRWGILLAGLAVSLSLVIGLDNLPLVVLLFGCVGLAWAFGMPDAGAAIRHLGLSASVSLLALYPLAVAPSAWFIARCDSISIVYLAAMGAVCAAFVLLPALPAERLTSSQLGSTVIRLSAGALAASLCGLVVWLAYPQCIGGPYGTLSAELTARWLARISEAKGLIDFVEMFGKAQLAVPLYLAILLVAGVWLRVKGIIGNAILPVLSILAISLLLSFLQVRALRIGVFAAVPLCVVLADLVRRRILAATGTASLSSTAMAAIACLPLLTPVWLLTAGFVFPGNKQTVVANAAAPSWQKERPIRRFCNHQGDYAVLASLPAGIVMNDLGSGPPILVFTHHSVVGGNYHRNEQAILDTLDFFAADDETARQIAARRGADYLVYCQRDPRTNISQTPARKTKPGALGMRLRSGSVPPWLELVSPLEDRLRVYRILR